MLEIIPPQVAAIAIGAVWEKPVVVKDENGNTNIEARKVIPINIAFDHRAADFGDVVPFFEKLDEIFENPQVIKEWI